MKWTLAAVLVLLAIAIRLGPHPQPRRRDGWELYRCDMCGSSDVQFVVQNPDETFCGPCYRSLR